MMSLREAHKLVEDIVAEKPFNYIYKDDQKTRETFEKTHKDDRPGNGCFYRHHDDTPGCIIGHVIAKLKPEFDLSSVETESAETAVKTAGIEAEDAVYRFFNAIQGEQDRGSTWRHSLERGKTLA